MNDKILVTGGNGFVGANLVRKLYQQKNQITIYSLKEHLHPFLKGLKINIKEGDIRDYKSLLKIVKGHKYVYHLAALTYNDKERRKEVFSVNVDGTENVMKACLISNVKKVVHVSTCGVLGFSKNKDVLLNENTNLDFVDNQYSQSKKISENVVRKYVSERLNAAIANPSFVIGAGEIDPARYTLAQSISRGRVKFAFPGGGGTIGIEDLVNGLILTMKKGKAGERYILSNENVLLVDRFNLMARFLDKPKIKFVIPRFTYYPMYLLGSIAQKFIKNPPISTEIVRWYFNYRNFDNTKAQRELGWKPKIPLKESIRRTINYYKSIKVL
tara:strand:+ start:521 stop:1504 length:984 start_codon:yes stop_codon:yes gene_type:complete